MDPRVREFHCIMPIKNISSVLVHGILSHEQASKIDHESVAMMEIQEMRDRKHIPGGLKLHQYANLYFHARNPMMYKRKEQAGEFCVLRIAMAILQTEGVVVTDCNAAASYARPYHPSQWKLLPFDDIFATFWTHSDEMTKRRLKARKCAEVLVPHRVDPKFLIGAYVVDGDAEARLRTAGFMLPIVINNDLFFH